jgi:hypothetical protein
MMALAFRSTCYLIYSSGISSLTDVFLLCSVRMLPLLLLAGAARGAEMMAAMPQAANAQREEAAAADQWAAPAAEKWAAAEPQYYYTPEGYLHQRSDGDQYLSGGAVAAGPWVTGEL